MHANEILDRNAPTIDLVLLSHGDLQHAGEDIIGTAEYKKPIEESLAEVERLSEERQEKLNRLRIVDKDRKALESRKKEAEDYLRLFNDLVRARSRLWQWYIWKCLLNEQQLGAKMVREKCHPLHL